MLYHDGRSSPAPDGIEALMSTVRRLHALNPEAWMSTQTQNERKFGRWEDLPGGGRRYWMEVPGRYGWQARYVKEVDASETTLRFRQEVYNEQGEIAEIHEKYPVDRGHRKA